MKRRIVWAMALAALAVGCERRPEAPSAGAQQAEGLSEEPASVDPEARQPTPVRPTTEVQAEASPEPRGEGPSAGGGDVATGDPLMLRPLSFAPLVKRVNPSVVNIYTKTVVRERPVQLDPFFHFAPRARVSESLGTGFIIDEKGLILTNNHVINGASEIHVRTAGGQEYEATVVGADPPTDLAVIQLHDAPTMQPVAMGDSDAVEVGDWVVAIGNALGLSSTVTAGIVSAKGRTELPMGGPIRFMDFIQTDASINPGNSGGPLLNLKGEVIGINTAINREGQGIGFAIPMNMARTIVEPLIKEGKVSRSWLGIYVAVVNEELAARAGLPKPTGAMVHRIIANGPAEKAGFQKGDIILEFDGHEVHDTNELRLRSSMAGVGKTVGVKVRRGQRDLSLEMTLTRSPHD